VQLYGAVTGNGVIVLSSDVPDWLTLRDVIAATGISRIAEAAEDRPVTHPKGFFTWGIPIPDPAKNICVGVNYPDRNAEYKDGTDLPKHMSIFTRFPCSHMGHDTPLTRPKVSCPPDYEGGLVVIIGKAGRHCGAGCAAPCCSPDHRQRRHDPRPGTAHEIQFHPR